MVYFYSEMKSRTSKSERTKAFIIERTASVFNKKGFAGTSLTDLTNATGLTKGALYGNFESKEAMAAAAFDFNTASVRNSLHAKASPEQDSISKLLMIPAFCREHFKTLAAQGGCPVLNTAVEADDNQPLLKKKVNATITRWKKNIELTIEQGIKNKEIKSSVDPSKYASIMIALFEGGVLLSKSTGELSFINHCADKMEDIINSELKR
jgi:AcrR family transcriptional regulator